MDLVNNLNNRKIAILGLGATGFSIIQYLKRYNVKVFCWDDSEDVRTGFEQEDGLELCDLSRQEAFLDIRVNSLKNKTRDEILDT